MKLRHLSEPNYLPVLDKSFAIERRVLGLAIDTYLIAIWLVTYPLVLSAYSTGSHPTDKFIPSRSRR